MRTDANEHNHLVNTRRRKEGHIYSAWSLIIFISAEEVPAFLQFLHWPPRRSHVSCSMLPNRVCFQWKKLPFVPAAQWSTSCRFIWNYFSVWKSKSSPWPSAKTRCFCNKMYILMSTRRVSIQPYHKNASSQTSIRGSYHLINHSVRFDQLIVAIS